MENMVIIGILLVIAFFSIRTIVKRKGRKGCCGSGSDYTPRKKSDCYQGFCSGRYALRKVCQSCNRSGQRHPRSSRGGESEKRHRNSILRVGSS